MQSEVSRKLFEATFPIAKPDADMLRWDDRSGRYVPYPARVPHYADLAEHRTEMLQVWETARAPSENHSRLVRLMAGIIRASGVDTGDCQIDADGPDLFACAADATARVQHLAADPFEQLRQAIQKGLSAGIKELVASLHKLNIESDDREGFRTWFTDKDGGLLQVGDPFDHPYAAADWCERNGFAWEVIGADDPVAGMAAWRAAQ